MCTPLLLTVGAVCCAHLEWLRSVIKQLVTTAQFEICATFRMLPGGYSTFESYFHDSLIFFREYEWLYSCAVTEILINDVLDKIPHTWIKALLMLSTEELNQLPGGYIKDDWPDSLKQFCEMCQKLKLSKKRYEPKEEEYCIPSIICNRLSQKKLHEICHFAQLINGECLSSGTRRIIDFGSGLGYVGQLLHAKYGYIVMGLEANHSLVEAAVIRQKGICDTKQVIYMIFDINKDTEDDIDHIIKEKMPPVCSHQCHFSDKSLDGIIYNLKSSKKTKHVDELSKNRLPFHVVGGKTELIVKPPNDTVELCSDLPSCSSKENFALLNAGKVVKSATDYAIVNLENSEPTLLPLCTDNLAKPVTVQQTCTLQSNESTDTVCLIGLHPCADLSATAAKIFTMVPLIRHLIIVPCCYHKMSVESYSQIKDLDFHEKLSAHIRYKKHCRTTTKKENFTYFPMSCALRQCIQEFPPMFDVFLQKPFLRLAAQETGIRWRSATKEIHETHSLNLMARAILYLCAYQDGYSLTKKYRHGVRKTGNLTFSSILEDIVSRYKFTAVNDTPADPQNEIRTEDIQHKMLLLWDKYKNFCSLAEVYTALQLTIQGAVESFVLLDKLAYLKEMMGSHVLCDLIKVMDEQISPRCHAIIARK